ncbi:MarR family winged helix-turn-helix transcriptional regulator [Cellulomonas fimi]|uniref:Winged helix-turn-helix transcriptional regulator n=1 Tax=Cellulomonas fimi TaxID=1708 RepID=A0A7Y0QI57_CELFI|nr:MarR family winged helix-turn-helix transcriptional regulator [Cellulomonas fimi]NMR20985.1 winged helix-turn-helix transcriptional regulator [Cellulomonas fimi]
MDQDTRWLSQEQEDAWRPLMAAMLLLPGALDAQLQRDAGLTHAGYGVLSALSEAPERTIRLSRLAHMASLSMSRLSHLVDRLEAAGWVERKPVPGDGRSTMAVLTEAGWDKIVATAPGHVETVQTLVFDDLTPAQTRQLRKIFEKIAPKIDPENRLQACGAIPAGRSQAGR